MQTAADVPQLFVGHLGPFRGNLSNGRRVAHVQKVAKRVRRPKLRGTISNNEREVFKFSDFENLFFTIAEKTDVKVSSDLTRIAMPERNVANGRRHAPTCFLHFKRVLKSLHHAKRKTTI